MACEAQSRIEPAVPQARSAQRTEFTVDLEAGWTLVRASDKQIVLRRAIKSTHTAGMGEALAGVVRLRLAVEGAARSNIAQGLAAIAGLNL